VVHAPSPSARPGDGLHPRRGRITGTKLIRTPSSTGEPEYTVRMDQAPVEELLAGPDRVRDLDQLAVAGACALADVSVRPRLFYPAPVLTLGGLVVAPGSGQVLRPDGRPVDGCTRRAAPRPACAPAPTSAACPWPTASFPAAAPATTPPRKPLRYAERDGRRSDGAI